MEPTDPGPGYYPLGKTTVTYTSVDEADNESTCEVVVTVVDSVPPLISPLTPEELWPPDHEYITRNLSDCASAIDLCEGLIDIDIKGKINSIYSDEPEDIIGGSDGGTLDDIIINNNTTFQIRRERQGGGNGRVYGVNFGVTDESGNVTSAYCYFGVPHSQNGDAPVDDGPDAGYTVPWP